MTIKKIEVLKLKDKQYKKADGQNLFLLVTPFGNKLWRFHYFFERKENTPGIGLYPQMSLKEALIKRDELNMIIRNGIKPYTDKKKKLAEQKFSEMELKNTFRNIALEWFEKMKPAWTEGHAKTVIYRLKGNVFPKIGDIPVSRIERPEYAEVIRNIEARGSLEVAKRVAQIIGQICRYALTIGAIKYDCATNLASMVIRRPVKPMAAIIDPEESGRLLLDIDD